MGKCHKGVIYCVAVVTIGFGLLITFAGVANVQNGSLAVNLVGGLINILTGALLLAGAIKNKRNYVNVFLWTWWILLALGTIGFIILATNYNLPEEMIIWGIAVLVVRWLMQFATLWAYCNMEEPTPQSSFKV